MFSYESAMDSLAYRTRTRGPATLYAAIFAGLALTAGWSFREMQMALGRAERSHIENVDRYNAWLAAIHVSKNTPAQAQSAPETPPVEYAAIKAEPPRRSGSRPGRRSHSHITRIDRFAPL